MLRVKAPRAKGRSKKAKGQGHHGNISAAFNVTSVDDVISVSSHSSVVTTNSSSSSSYSSAMSSHVQLDINTATEEELMTLPGVNRETARNIVDYRGQICGYRKVEDIALVSGVGAAKFVLIRHEICVSKPAINSTANSSMGSGQLDIETASVGAAVQNDASNNFRALTGNELDSSSSGEYSEDGSVRSLLGNRDEVSPRRQRRPAVHQAPDIGALHQPVAAGTGDVCAAA